MNNKNGVLMEFIFWLNVEGDPRWTFDENKTLRKNLKYTWFDSVFDADSEYIISLAQIAFSVIEIREKHTKLCIENSQYGHFSSGQPTSSYYFMSFCRPTYPLATLKKSRTGILFFSRYCQNTIWNCSLYSHIWLMTDW